MYIPTVRYIVLMILLIPYEITGQKMIYSLDDLVNMGLESNIQVINANMASEIADFQAEVLRSQFQPQVEAYTDFIYSYAIPQVAIPGEIIGQTGPALVQFGTKYDWSFGLRLSQVIYNRSLTTRHKLAKQNVSLEEHKSDLVKEELVYQIANLYFTALHIERQQNTFSEILNNLEQVQKLIMSQYSSELIAIDEVNRISVELNQLRNQSNQLERQYVRVIGMLRTLCNIDNSLPLQLRGSLDEKSTDIKALSAHDNNLQYEVFNDQIEIAKLQVAASKADFMPTANAFAQHYYQGLRDEFDFFDGGPDRFFNAGLIGVSLNVPIYSGRARSKRLRQQSLQLQMAENSREQLHHSIQQELQTTISNYNKLKKELSIAEKNRSLAHENYEIIVARYEQQMTPLTEVLLAENSKAQSAITYNQFLFELRMAEVNILKITGQLLNKF